MGVLCFVFMIGALRVNVILVFLLFTLTMAFTFFTGAYWSLAKGNVLVAEKLVVVSGLSIWRIVSSTILMIVPL